MRIAVYPGSFDPFTLGHLDILERSMKMFDKVIVGVLVNSSKKCLLQPSDRVALINEVLKGRPQVEVREFEGLLVDFCWKMEACAIIRGLRAVSDYEYEMQLATINKQLAPTLETVFLMSSSQYSFLSSSIVKEIARFGGDIASLV
ncbi:MAG TPA: pantetheine-phosphate adenylyltransferase, partial [Candidatus Ozemobacteraceae bacterium]|nr:pantetheine-phosphate adenylyltransferase [Candidatus Ozemobacteraceae bacterium]